MVLKNFEEMIERVKKSIHKRTVALVAAEDINSLKALLEIEKEGIARPVLVGNEQKIRDILKELGATCDYEIYDEPDSNKAACKAVELVRDGKADFLMKGKIQTADILRAVVNKEKGLGQGKLMSHFVIMEIPTYHKLLAITDGGMVMYPNLEQKKEIIINAVEALSNIGYKNPKVGVLAAVEKVNPKMPETVDAHELKEMNIKGEIKNCIIEGPISYDLSMNKESARIKGYESQVAGDVDLLVVPDIAAGNIMSKSLIYSANARMAGMVIGAKVPIVLTSRGASAEEKFLSLALAALFTL